MLVFGLSNKVGDGDVIVSRINRLHNLLDIYDALLVPAFVDFCEDVGVDIDFVFFVALFWLNEKVIQELCRFVLEDDLKCVFINDEKAFLKIVQQLIASFLDHCLVHVNHAYFRDNQVYKNQRKSHVDHEKSALDF